MRRGPKRSRFRGVHRLRTAAAVSLVSLFSLAGCAGWPAQNDAPDAGELLRNSLPVAGAALAAGQTDVARRLYLALAERYDDAPEPFLGLGYAAFQSRDLPAAEKYFLQAAKRASEAPATRAEALLGAGRTALARGNTGAARRHFESAREPGGDTPLAAWIENGLAVAAALDSDWEAAAAHHAEALRRSSGDPRIAANHVRALIAAGRIDEATRAYRRHPPTYWADEDGPVLDRLVEEARRERHRQMLAGALAAPPAGGGAVSAPSGHDASPLRDPAAAPASPERRPSQLGQPAELQNAPEFQDAPELQNAPELQDAPELEDAPELADPEQPPSASWSGKLASLFGRIADLVRPSSPGQPPDPEEPLPATGAAVPTVAAGSAAADPEQPAPAFDASLALRLPASDSPPEAEAFARRVREIASRAPPDLMLVLDRWPETRTPSPAVNGATARPPSSESPGASPPDAVPGTATSASAARSPAESVAESTARPSLPTEATAESTAGPSPPAEPIVESAAGPPAPTEPSAKSTAGPPAPTEPSAKSTAGPPAPTEPSAESTAAPSPPTEPIAESAIPLSPPTEPVGASTARSSLPAEPAGARPEPSRPESGSAAAQAGSPAPGAGLSAVARTDSPGRTSGLPGSPPAGALAPAPSGAARAHPLPEPEAPLAAASDPFSPPPLVVPFGQSRRMHLAQAATTVLVASPEVADVQLLAPDVLYVLGKEVGRTSVAVLDENEWIEERVVSVVLDLEPLHTVLAGEPDLRGVRARRLLRGVAMTGEVASVASVDRALRLAAGALPEGVPIENEMQVAAPQQVALEVQIAEVSRSVTENLGVNWEAVPIRGGERFGFRIGRAIGPFTGVLPDSTLIDGQPAAGVYWGKATAGSRIGVMIDALATAGLANVLARPTLTAVSGETASFFSGGERPTPTGYDSSTDTIIFEYKKVGVLLDFVPTVIDAERIVLTVRPEVSEPDNASQPLLIGPVAVPVINVRRAETTVEVGDGESIVIAGLFRNRSSTNESGVPVLKDAPILGALFGQTSVQSDEHELIVIVTARLTRARAAPDDTDARPATLQASGYHY